MSIRLLSLPLILACVVMPLMAEDHGHHHGAVTALGSATIGAFTVTAARAGDIVAGKETVIEVTVTPKPKAVRLWIGIESGKGSTKAKGEAEGEGFHAHVDVPAELPADAKLWVSVEPETGDTVKGSFALTPAAAEPAHSH